MAGSPGVEWDLTLGLILVGLAATGSLFGVTSAQSVWYFKSFPQDRRTLKLLVAVIWMLDLVHLGLYSATMWIYLVQKTGLSFTDDRLPWSANIQLLCNSIAVPLVQSFYAYRIWTLSRRKFLLTIMVIFIAGTGIFSVVLFVKTILTTTVAQYILLTAYDIAQSAMLASTDILLCGVLVYLLSSSRTGTQGADRLINKLMLYTVNTGLLTSVFAVLAVIMVCVMPSTSYFVMFYYIGTRLYSVSLLATLNARHDLRKQAERMCERSLPNIEITTHRVSYQPRQSAQGSSPRRLGVSAAPTHDKTATSSSTGDSDASTAPPHTPTAPEPLLWCDGARCFVWPGFEEDGLEIVEEGGGRRGAEDVESALGMEGTCGPHASDAVLEPESDGR